MSWKGENSRHGLASRGIKTKLYKPIKKMTCGFYYSVPGICPDCGAELEEDWNNAKEWTCPICNPE